jgi:hypothetical protein
LVCSLLLLFVSHDFLISFLISFFFFPQGGDKMQPFPTEQNFRDLPQTQNPIDNVLSTSITNTSIPVFSSIPSFSATSSLLNTTASQPSFELDTQDFSFLSTDRYFVAQNESTQEGFVCGELLHLQKGDVIYRSCDGPISTKFEGIVASGTEVSRVGYFNFSDFTGESEETLRSQSPLPLLKDGCDLRLRCLSQESDYERIWDSHHLPCKSHATFWKVHTPPGFYKFCDIVEKTTNRKLMGPHESIRQGVYVVSASFTQSNPLLRKPLNYELLWCGKTNTNQPVPLCIWKIIPPIDYVSLGHIITFDSVLPSTENVICVHKSLTLLGLLLFLFYLCYI